MALEQRPDGVFRSDLAHLFHHGRFLHAGVDPPAQRGQPDGQQKRHAPAPLQKRLAGGDHGHQRQHAGGQQQPRWHAHLGTGTVEAALVGRRVLHGQKHGRAPLAAGGGALQDTQQHQGGRREPAGGFIRRQQPDQRGGGAHGEQRDHEHAAAPQPVAEVACQHRTERPEQKRQPDGEEAGDRRRRGPEWAEHDLVEHQSGDGGVEEVVVPLDGGADGRGRDDAASLTAHG